MDWFSKITSQAVTNNKLDNIDVDFKVHFFTFVKFLCDKINQNIVNKKKEKKKKLSNQLATPLYMMLTFYFNLSLLDLIRQANNIHTASCTIQVTGAALVHC